MCKMSFILVFMYIGFLIVFVKSDVRITGSGIIPWKEGDFAIVFYDRFTTCKISSTFIYSEFDYPCRSAARRQRPLANDANSIDITLNNYGYRPVTVFADMIKCCEQIDKTDIDCDHFQLIGSSLDLAARDSKIITLHYLNIYSYNRRGECDVRVNIIYNRNEHVESTVIQKIYFDTTVTQGIKCEFPDEDRLDYCNPVNCHMKYSGYRGFFSTSRQKCVKIPTCQSKNNKDQAYIWLNNQCADLNHIITQKDIQEVLSRIENNKSDEQFRTFDEIHSIQIIRCHNGYLNSITDLCECDFGWESENNINWNDFIPSTIPIQMCTIRKQISKNYIQSLKFALIPKNCTFIELVSFNI